MAVVDVTLEQLTTGALEGTGVFDALMRAAKAHLDDQFNQDRIRGPEYSTVYLGQLEAAMQTALAFLASQQKIGPEAELVRKQIALAEAQLLQTQRQTALIDQQILNAVTENTVLVAQECKLRAEFNLTTKNIEKTSAEITLLTQKVATEKAQILSMGVDSDSVVGRQKALYLAQADGFKRDAEQKAAQIMADVWKTCRMTDDAWQANATNGLDDVSIGSVMRKLQAGIGVVPA